MNTIIKYSLVLVLGMGLLACNNTENADKQDNDSKTNIETTTPVESNGIVESDGNVHKINTQQFIDQIFDYKSSPNKWVYKGDIPTVVDFYADWCGPCKRVAPIMDKLAEKYKGKILFVKINTDENRELAGNVFGIQSIPSMLFIPVGKEPQMKVGAFAEADYTKIIDEFLLQ